MASRRKAWRRWRSGEVRALKRLYPMTPTAVIAERLGRTCSQVYGKAQVLGLRKSPEFYKVHLAGRLDGVRGEGTRFKPGHKSWNKGTNFHAGGRSVETQFKAGQQPHNAQPIGAESWDATGYLKRKVRDDAPPGMSRRNWRFVHVLLWEEHNGPVPAGHVVVFVNGDRRDIRIENLELLDRRDLMKRNTLHRYPKEIAHAMQLRGALNRQINRRTRKHEEQDGRPA